MRGLTIRTHGESGVPEGDAERYRFWQTLMSGIARAGRPVEIDLHAKGVDQRIIDIALATGQSVRVSPKFWAEHMGLPYLQASIRALELPREDRADPLMAMSTGSRNHMRYSYGDVLRDDRRYGVLHRVWPGSERLLLWGDPVYAAEMGRAFGAHGADGVEYMEPLSFKGRKGSGLAWGRNAYRDASLRDSAADWRKYEYTYRLWGRLAYAPDEAPEAWRRRLGREHGDAAEAIESGLARASRILPLVSSAHCPSAANNNYWPEMYSNMSLVDDAHPGSYSDTPTPKVFGAVTSLDPQLFAGVDECADALVRGEPLARVTPIQVARQLDLWADSAAADLARAEARTRDRGDPRHRRVAVDVAIAAGIGRFFARKLRAGVLYRVYDQTGDARARDAALVQYREARRAWAEFALGPAQAYVADVTFGFDAHLRGHWQDRLAAIDRDIAAVEARAAARSAAGGVDQATLERAVAAVLSPGAPPSLAVEHTPPVDFRPGAAIPLSFRVSRAPTPFASFIGPSTRPKAGASSRRRETASGGAPRCPPPTRTRPIRSSTTSRCARPRASRCGPASRQTSPDSRTGSSGGPRERPPALAGDRGGSGPARRPAERGCGARRGRQGRLLRPARRGGPAGGRGGCLRLAEVGAADGGLRRGAAARPQAGGREAAGAGAEPAGLRAGAGGGSA